MFKNILCISYILPIRGWNISLDSEDSFYILYLFMRNFSNIEYFPSKRENPILVSPNHTKAWNS